MKLLLGNELWEMSYEFTEWLIFDKTIAEREAESFNMLRFVFNKVKQNLIQK